MVRIRGHFDYVNRHQFLLIRRKVYGVHQKKKEKINLYFNIEKELTDKKNKLLNVETELKNKETKLDKINKEIENKNIELDSLKRESVELKDYINYAYRRSLKDSKYEVELTNLYIVKKDNKYYIARRVKKHQLSKYYSLMTGRIHYDYISLYDVLNVEKLDDGSFRSAFLCKYTRIWADSSGFSERYIDDFPDEEVHILDMFPELSYFENNRVPDKYLRKIYYEINDLGNKEKSKEFVKRI